MKILCGREDLIKGSQIVQTIVSPRSTLPILSNFLLETDGSQIKLSSTDLEIGVSCHVKAEVRKEGSVTIPAKRFGDIIRELPADTDIEISTDDASQVNIKCLRSKFNLMGLPKTDYPVLPAFPKDNVFTLKSEVLRSMLKQTSFAVSGDESRYVLNGVFFLVEGGMIRVVATDGRRLAFIQRNAPENKMKAKAIIPTKAVNEIQRVLANDDPASDVKIGITDNQIAFQTSSITLISRLIEGTFPNYEQVIPKKSEIQITLNVKETFAAVRQMALLASDKASIITFSFSRNLLRINASAQGLGSGESEIAVEYAGANLDIAFNPVFLIDVFKNLSEDQVSLELTNGFNPAVIRTVKDKHYLCVVMPIRT